jgi:hypothetical protein
VLAVKSALGAKSNSDLARKLGLGHEAPQQIGRWLRGENEPNYSATMVMLERCGWLNMLQGVPAPPADAPDHLEELRVGLARILENQDQGLATLDRLEQLAERLERLGGRGRQSREPNAQTP